MRAFLPSFARGRRRRAVPEVVAAPEIKPLEWDGRKKERCKLALYKDANGKPLCEEMFVPNKGNLKTCSPKCGRKLRQIRIRPVSNRYAKRNPAKVAALQRRRYATNPEVRARQAEYQKANRPLYNVAQQRYVDKNRAEVNARRREGRALKKASKPPVMIRCARLGCKNYFPAKGVKKTCSPECSREFELAEKRAWAKKDRAKKKRLKG